MDWFWNRKTKRKPKRKKPAPSMLSNWREHWDPQRAWLIARWSCGGALVIAIVWGWVAYRPALIDYAVARRAASEAVGAPSSSGDGQLAALQPPMIELADAPTWLNRSDDPRGLKPAIEALVAQHISIDPLAHEDLDHARASLEQCAWIKQVDRVERVDARHIRVFAEYREPVAAIQNGDKKYKDQFFLVDIEGVRLLRAPHTRQQINAQGFAVISGVQQPPGAVGTPWAGDDVAAGLKVVDLLRDRPYLRRIRDINVSERSRDGRTAVILQANNGGKVRWGFAPGEERGSEIAAEKKLFALDQLFYKRDEIAVPGKQVEFNGYGVFVRALH